MEPSGLQIINLSLGTKTPSDGITEGVKYLLKGCIIGGRYLSLSICARLEKKYKEYKGLMHIHLQIIRH